MNARKAELRKIVLDLVFGRKQVTYAPNHYTHLSLGVAEVLYVQKAVGGWGSEQKLDGEDELLVLEIFWDLIVEKVLTVGIDSSNRDFPYFRLHSEAETNLRP